ncbi:MAG: hypothetical protein AAF802_05330 [Planctomycetota bacterium]
MQRSDEPQIEVGRPHPVVDSVGWLVGVPEKILLWDRRVENHSVSPQTLDHLADYLHTNHLSHVKVRANQYAPIEDFRRLTRNKSVAWPYRYTFGLAQVARDAVLPGRVFGGDHFNPYTQTIHLFSDVPAIALHEGGHAKDFARRKYQGTYALAYQFVPMWHEKIATEDAFAFLHARNDHNGVKEANRILYPAYGSYVGSTVGTYFPAAGFPIYLTAVAAGHANGRALNRQIDGNVGLDTVAYSGISREASSEPSSMVNQRIQMVGTTTSLQQPESDTQPHGGRREVMPASLRQ